MQGPDGKVAVRLYVPQAHERSLIAAPAFVYYHGGGFVAGDLESDDTLLRAFANRAQCIVISVAYRLAPENPYPAATDNAWTVLTWGSDHDSKIGVDPHRLVIGGDSAGGLLGGVGSSEDCEAGCISAPRRPTSVPG